MKWRFEEAFEPVPEKTPTPTTARDLLKSALNAIGADGLCWCPGDSEERCGCGTHDLAPCENINLDECVAARRIWGLFVPIMK